MAMVSDGPPLGVAIVGYGYWGATIGRNLALSDSTEFVGVVDPDPGVRTRTRRPHPSITVWSSLRDALEDSRVQAVIVATPAAFHSELSLQALRAGRHVLVEKPLALKPTDARDICDVARHLELIAMVGPPFCTRRRLPRSRGTSMKDDLGGSTSLPRSV